MAIYSKLSNVKKLTNSSLGAIIDVSNINFTDLSSAVLEFLKNISYDETTNSINELYNINTSYLNVSSQFNVKLNDVITFKIDPQGRAEGNSFLVKVAEAKRYRHTDFNDWPLVGIPGEVIYTGVQNQRPQFGEDFIGYLDTRGWVSLTSLSDPVPGLNLLTEIGSPIIIPSPLDGTGIVWIGPPNLENNYAPVNTSIYFTDDDGNTFDILTNFVWEKIGIDAKFIPEGKVIIGDGIVVGQFQYVDGNETAGYVLYTDGAGNAYWAPNTGSGGGGPLNYSYWELASFTADVTKTITHNLATDNIVVNFIDTATNERVNAHVDNYTANTVDVTLTTTNATVKIVALAAGGAAGIPTIQKMSIYDKGWVALSTSADGDPSSLNTLTNTPVDVSYVEVKVNGVEYEVGDGVNTKSCFFADPATPTLPRGFSSAHVNGQVQSGDKLYWNGTAAGFELIAGWRISLNYMIT